MSELDETYFIYPEEKDFSNEIIATSYNYLIAREIDRHNFSKAHSLISGLLEKDNLVLNDLTRQLLTIEMLFIDILSGREEIVRDKFDKKLKKLTTSMAKTHLFANRFLFAYEKLVLKKEENVDTYLRQFEKIALKYPYKGDLAQERELLDIVKNM